jgi:hypothetical protein
MPDPVDYRAPTTESPHPRRSIGTWIVLAVVWTVGIAIWGVYLALAVYVLLRFL